MISTLRAILITNKNVFISSFLTFLISIVWILSSTITIININVYSILAFSMGSVFGCIIGNFIEEKIAFGNILLICITSSPIDQLLRNNKYIVTSINSNGINGLNNVLLIVIKRNKLKKLIKDILYYDNKAIILNEFISINKNRL